jgi:hypothetical protein
MSDNRTLLDSFKKFEFVNMPGHKIRPGDFFYYRYPNLGIFRKELYESATKEEWVKVSSVTIDTFPDGSVDVTLVFEGVESSLEINGHNYYNVKTFSFQNN